MDVIELISNTIPPLKTSDSIQKVVERMAEFRVAHLPIVKDAQFIGLISDEDIIEISDYNTKVRDVTLSLINPYIFESQHIYDAIRMFYERKISIIPVVDHHIEYLGVVTMDSLVEYMATLTSARQPGGIIVLEINNRDNSLAHIAQIVESENAQILSSYINAIPGSTKIEVTIKVNKVDIAQIVASFLRYEYVIIATYNYSDKNNGSSDRFDSFMNYLSI
jgi:acetoin utilization protein AcuB